MGQHVHFCFHTILTFQPRLHNSNNKRAYLYKLTPTGIEAKARISVSFLRHKMREYEQLKKEIDQLQNEVNGKNETES